MKGILNGALLLPKRVPEIVSLLSPLFIKAKSIPKGLA
jgi:hypothetical protein